MYFLSIEECVMKKLFISVVIIILMYVSLIMCAKSKQEDIDKVKAQYGEQYALNY